MKEKISLMILKTEQAVNSAFREIISIIFVIIWTILWFPVAVKMSFAKSYYPEKTRKIFIHRIADNIYWVLRYHRANVFYTLYGLDIKGRYLKDYIDEKSFWKDLDKLNYGKSVTAQTCLLRDKYLFYKYMKINNLPVPEIFGILRGGVLYDSNLNLIDIEQLKTYSDYFIKDVDGECASFVRHINDYNDLINVMNKMQIGTYILQSAVRQNEEMNRLNPNAINTLRIITLNSGNEQRFFSAVLRVGTTKSGHVDNWAAGGLSIGIEDNGCLKSFGFYKPGYGEKTDFHPDTGVHFSEFEVPMFEQAIKLACQAHKYFYGIGAIGWDIAITDHGPVFIEGNDNFEMSLMQGPQGGLRELWKCMICKIS